MTVKKVASILEIPISLSPESELLAEMKHSIGQKKGLFITTPNPEIIVEAQKDPAYKKILQSADIALPDGTGVVLALSFHGQKISRIRGREFFLKLLDMASQSKWSVYLVGSGEASMGTSIARIRDLYPQITVNGSSKLMVDTAGLSISNDIEGQIVNDMKKHAPDLVFVALGHPKQEKWIYRIREMFPNTTFMAIGGTLDTFSGSISLPPTWMSRLGVEWLFRVIQEPGRIKRIFTATVIFPFLVLLRSR